MVVLRQIHPAPGGEVSAVDAYALPPGTSRHLRVNMVSSIDGAATLSGRVGSLTGPADQELLGVLRSLCDVLLVGGATIRAEGYGPVWALPGLVERRRADGQQDAPRLAVLTGSLDVDLGSVAFTEAVARPIVLTTERAAPERVAAARGVADVLVVGETSVDVARVLDLLAGQGLGRVLSEGGPGVLAGLFGAGLVDELCLATSPIVVAGDESRITRGAALPAPVPMRLAAAYERDGFLFTRYVRSPRA